MFNQNFKVMKQKIFTLVLMLALVVMAGKSFAAPTQHVTAGGTYSYSVNGIVVTTAGTGTISYDNGGTVSNVTGFTGAGPTYVVPTGGITVGFKVHYSQSATSGTITVTVTDGAASGCSNHITLAITVDPKPSFDYTIASSQSTPYCSTTSTTTDNTAGSYHSNNTITYTVSRNSVTNAPFGGYTWGFTIDIPNTTAALGNYKVMYGSTDITSSMGTGYAVTSLASTVTSVDFVVTFYTTTGNAAQTLTGTESAGYVTDSGAGGDTYDETTTPENYDVTIKSVPSIGSFQ
jgi:hypothetical protein